MTHEKTYNSLGEKFCNNCQDYHPISMFGKNRVSKDNLSWSCAESLRLATEGRRVKNIANFLQIRHGKLIDDATDKAVKMLKLVHPDYKLANPYQYQMPDAWENYKQTKIINL